MRSRIQNRRVSKLSPIIPLLGGKMKSLRQIEIHNEQKVAGDSGFSARASSEASCGRLIFDNLFCHIVDDNRTVKIDNGRLAAIFFSDEIFPFLRIEMLGILS